MGGEYGILDRMVILINYFDLNHGDDQISIDTYTYESSTIEINMLKVEKSNFYLVKLGIFPTTFYNDTKGA